MLLMVAGRPSDLPLLGVTPLPLNEKNDLVRDGLRVSAAAHQTRGASSVSIIINKIHVHHAVLVPSSASLDPGLGLLLNGFGRILVPGIAEKNLPPTLCVLASCAV